MTKKILLYPKLFVSYAKFLFCIYVEIICSLGIQKFVLCVEQFESGDWVVIFSAQKGSFSYGKFLLLSVVDYFLNIFRTEFFVSNHTCKK